MQDEQRLLEGGFLRELLHRQELHAKNTEHELSMSLWLEGKAFLLKLGALTRKDLRPEFLNSRLYLHVESKRWTVGAARRLNALHEQVPFDALSMQPETKDPISLYTTQNCIQLHEKSTTYLKHLVCVL